MPALVHARGRAAAYVFWWSGGHVQVLGEGGYVPAPPEFMSALRRICDETEILLVADEVQSGFGRTGKMFAIDGHYNVAPDILIMAKGLASGMPISAVSRQH